MKHLFGFSFFLLFILQLNAQLITCDPIFPNDDDAVVITFDAKLGSGGLAGYDGDVYAHTGVITNESTSGTDWKHVKAGWGVNIPDCKLVSVGEDLWQFTLSPSIRDYYGVPSDETILEIAFVFRSATEVEGNWLTGKTADGSDIFYEVGNVSLSVSITVPAESPLLVELNDTVYVNWIANMADSSFLYVGDQKVFADTGTNFEYKFEVTESGLEWVKAVGINDTEMVVDSFYYYVRGEVIVEEKPVGVRDGINYINDTTVILCLYAPEKEFVFAWGDHSNWELTDDIYMKQTPDAERYWIEITGLEPKKQYIFQYFIDGDPTQLVGDMYCEQVSDPWDDQYINSETYPDLPPYPDGKTAFLASVFQTAQDKYQWQVENFTPPKKEDLVIYELLVRDFIEKHDYNTLIDTLDYLKRLGINAVELMPVNEFEGNSSWGYNPNYYFAPDKYYGPRNTLKAFIDECHSRGIAVILDMVLNHSYGSPFVQMYYDKENNRPAANSPWYNIESNFPYADANWGNDFNHESTATQALVDSVNSYWMSEYKMDGFRFDFTKGFSNTIHGEDDPWGSKYDADRVAILKRMSDEIWNRNENAFIIFEHLADNSEEKELANYGIMMWGNLNYAYNEGTMGYNGSGKSDFSWISYKKRGWNDPNVVGYMESHDEERLMYKNVTYGDTTQLNHWIQDTIVALERQELAAAFFFTIPGPKMIWQFGERGYDYTINYNPWNPNANDCRLCEKPPKWNYMENWNRRHLFYVYQALIELKKNEDVFETEDYDLSVSSAMKKIRLTSPEMSAVVLGNFDVLEGEINPNFYFTGTWYDYFSGEELEVANVSTPITLKPGEYRLYTSKKLDTPDFVGVDENNTPNILGNLYLYPNPASNQLNLDIYLESSSIVTVDIYDIQGKQIKKVYNNKLNGGLQHIRTDISGINQGLYFVSISADNQLVTRKLLIN